jgi:hypothetical protein
MKDRIIVTLLFLFVCFVGFEFGRLYFKERKEKTRLQNSFAAAETSLSYYKAKNGELVAKSSALELRFHEMEQIYPQVVAELKNLGIKPRHVNTFTETVVKNEKEIVTHIKDSTVMDTVRARVFNYRDSFYTVEGIAIHDTERVHITSRDSIIQVVYKAKRYRPWLWILSRRKLEQVITFKNPNSTVLYNRTIQLSRRP